MRRLFRRLLLICFIAALVWYADNSVYHVSGGMIGILETDSGVKLFPAGVSFSASAPFSSLKSYRTLPASGFVSVKVSAEIPALHGLDDPYLGVFTVVNVKYSINPAVFALSRGESFSAAVSARAEKNASVLLQSFVLKNLSGAYVQEKILSAWNISFPEMSSGLKAGLESAGINSEDISFAPLYAPDAEKYKAGAVQAYKVSEIALAEFAEQKRIDAEYARMLVRVKALGEELSVVSKAMKENPEIIRYLSVKEKDAGVLPINSSIPALSPSQEVRKDIDNFVR